ncbi:hypothetical protein KUCAC02_026948 [Chaenocephalus aceratus]|nr:hypothetical protein KUCAC02_026948 [Chaenocephalus aceratus]
MRGEESSDSESGRMEESSVRRSLETLCQELNMDEQTAAETLENFTAIWNTYTLEGEVVHWLACSLYAACRKGSTPTVGKGLMEGNCVSLTRILRTAKLSLIQFFSKMRKWADMSSLSQDFRLRMDRLERNFEVSTVIFRKFEPIFMDMFQNPQGGEPPRQPRSRKHRRLPCHISDVFKFCWTLFVYTKGNFRMIGDDLVNSYHLLLCCLDLVFGNALLCANRKDLINPTFRDPERNEDNLTELLDPQSFIDNNKAINREYEEYVLTVGDFDERVFLGADADEEIGTPRKTVQETSASRNNAQIGLSRPLHPLTGRVYLKEKDLLVTPVSSATQSVSRLQSMVSGLRTAPSENMLQVFRSCSRNPTESLLARVKTLGQTFKEHYTKDSADMPGSHIDFAENRLKLAEILYYKVLENVMVQETKRLPGKDMSVIEVFIRSEEGLSRDMVKHLNLIEEQVLDSRAWSADSALWIWTRVQVLAPVEFSLTCRCSPSRPSSTPRIKESDRGLGSARKDVPPSPLSLHDRYSSPAAGSAKRRLFGDDSPAPLTATLSPMSMSSPAKRLTFTSSSTLRIGGLNNDRNHHADPVQPCDSSGTITAQFLLTTSPSRPPPPHPMTSDPPAAGSGRPRRTGSLALFFRKGSVCEEWTCPSELRGKIWTCFEHALVHGTALMKDRHPRPADALLRITKETHTFHDIMKCYRGQPQASSHVYRSVLLLRHTPREQVTDENMEVDPVSGGESAEKTNQAPGEANADQSGEEERGDLIQFYNSVFVLKMKSFALRYAVHDNRVDAPPLSPFPSVRASASLPPQGFSETLALRFSSQELCGLPHTRTPTHTGSTAAPPR